MIMTGTSGTDTITGTTGGDLISSGNGNDTINGSAGNDIIDAGNGDDKVNGGAGVDLIFGGNGNDTLDGGSGSDVVSGGNGNDILIYGASENVNAIDIYDGGNGQDTLRLIVSQSMASSAGFLADIAALQAKLAHGSATYLFNSFNLLVTDIEKLQIVIEPSANHPPVAVADVASTNEDTTLTIIASALLANDTDPDANDTKAIVSVQGAQHGTVSLNSSGNVVFTADANYSGVASFTYTMKDSAGATSTATVTVNVAAVNDAPTATNLSASETYKEDTPLNLTDIIVTDLDSATVTVKLALSNPAAGTLSTGASGGVTSTYNALTGVWSASGATADVNALLAGVTFNPAANFNGSFSIATSVSDGVAPPVIGAKIFSGIAVNDAPIATNLSAPETYTEDTALNLSDIVITDIDSSTITATLTLSNPAAGALSTTTSGAVTSTYAGGVWTASGATADVNALLAGVKFIPAANFNGNFSIATTVSDGTASVTGAKAFTGVAVNDAPVAIADALAATEDSAITFTRAQLLGNDTDIDNSNAQLSISSVTSATGGSAVLNSDGSVTFTPTHDVNGAATFTYTITDGHLTSTPATATVNIAPVATAPTIAHERIEANVTTAPIALNIQISDPDTSDTLASTVQVTGVPPEYMLTAGAQSTDDPGVWIVNLSDVAGLAIQLKPDATAEKQTIALSITASSFDHANVAQKTEVLNIQINDPGVKVAADGYIADALVFVDKADGNGVYNGILDLGESFTYTASDGTFSLDTSGGQLVLQSVHGGGHNTIDVLTGLPFNGTLKAPSGSTVVTPLTNLIVAVAGAGGDTAAAEASVKAALGLSDSVSLTTLDPIAATVSAAPGAADVLAASIQVQATVAQLSAATGASAESVIGALAQTVAAGNVDLGAPSTVSALATVVNNTLPPGQQLSTADLNAVAQVVQESNAQISSSLANTTDLSQVAQAAQVAFGDTTQALSDAANGAGTTTFSSVHNDYTGAALEQKIAAAPLTLTGTEVADTLTGGDGNDLIFGLGGNDTLKGGAGDDMISGGAGKDALTGGAGNDTLDGGADFDRAIYTEATDGITVHLGAGTATGAGVGTDTLISIDGVIGSNFNDYLDGTGYTGSTGLPGAIIGFAEFEGGAGDDTIIGGSNVQGHALTRVSYLGASAGVTVDIQSGQAYGTAPGDVANVGHDTISNILNVWGSNYDDTLLGSDNGSGSFEAFEGRRGNDFVDGRGGYDVVVYATDLTTTTGITVNMAAGTVTGDVTVGTDTLRNVEAVRGTNFADYYNASNFGTAGTANIGSLGTFNDFQGGGGDDVVIGNGNTRVNYSSALAGVTVNLQTDLNQAGVTATNVVGSATATTEGTDSLTGVNATQGSSFDDTLLGSNFNNTFTGLGGDDFIDGRGGFDTASYNSMTLATSGIAVEMAAGTVTDNVNNVIGHDTLRNVEGVQGTGYADTFDATGYGLGGALNVSTSNGNFNQFEGLGGDDVITGNGATRVLYSNATGGVSVTIGVNGAGTATGDASTGHDSFTGGVNAAIGSNFADSYDASAFNNGFNSFQGNGGNDTITGNGATQVQYSNATSGVAITIGAGGAGSASGDGSVGTDTFTGVNSAVGGNLNDSYNASAYNGGFNSFQGNGGNDTITGNGATQVQYNNATGAVNVNLSTGTATGDGSVGTDTITGGVNNVLGSNFADSITGSSGADFLNGNGGNDTINGGGGNDNLSGGAGADTFVYANGGGADFISDFNRGQGDRIDVTGVTGVFTLADIQAHASQQGPNTVMDFGGGNMITLANIAVGSLVATDFVFNNTVIGTSGNDTLVGTSQIDGIYGLDGNDRLQGLGGNDLLDGGNGFDRAVYTEATGSITVNLAAGTASGAGVGSDTLVSIEGAVGGAFNDTFNAAGFTGSSAQPGVAAGQSGFEGRGGDDVITGRINDLGQSVTRVEYLGASAAVTVDLAAGTGQGTAAGDLANVGHDTFTNALQGVFGSAFNDTIYGSDNANFTYEAFEGRAGNDYIDGRGGYDIVAYNNDPATGSGITVNLAAGTVTGDATVGTDTLRNVEAVRGTIFDDVFDTTGYGAPGALNISTTNGNFNDIAGAGGNDSITGNGNTRLNYSIAQAAVTVDLETTAGTAITVAGSATGTTEGTDTFTGVNAVQASVFNDTLLGSSYNNTFTPLGGDDYIDGRGGFDTASYNNLNTTTGGIAVAMAAGTVTGDASIGHDTLRNIEGVQGTGYADTFDATGYGLGGALNVSTSNGNFNQFEGLGGDDVITGNGATRVLYSNATGGVSVTIGVNGAGTATGDASTGHDSFTGGVNAAIGSNFADSYDASAFNNGFNSFQGNGGNDTITGNGATQVQYSNATSGVAITIGAGGAGSASGDGSVGTDTFTGVNSAVGGNLNDSYNASAYNGGFNSFQGNGGNDTITGNGATQVQYNNATGAVNVNLSTGTATGDGSVGTDTITGGVNNVLGSNFADSITGSSGADFLNGNGGNDTINGGGGNDNLNGGGGNDNFVFVSGATAGATITDFTGNGPSQGDTLEFHGFGLSADGATLTQIGLSNQWLVHSGLDAHDETITINGAVYATDFHFLT
ncbi:tandem-95 repeat protein [Bradyrhizobium sp. 15]|uniref:tandem-95 repeat protein n=1 Tax=Bradyrhizobium sp. 15 TaxID=2782633 RepID=UPI0023EE935A|nr:tandem-95 repeat protein [Bradyrhizobium sp. 15]MCK1434963.1 tandem-95 repeat protein [Bradyrhizobium sp. 15]